MSRDGGTLGAQEVSRKCSISPSSIMRSFDVIIYKNNNKPAQGHTGFVFNTTNGSNEYVVGGNQGDSVKINNSVVYSKNFTKYKGGIYNNNNFDKPISKSDAKIVIDYLNGLTTGLIPLDENNAKYITIQGAKIQDRLLKENFLSLVDFENSLLLPTAPLVSQNIKPAGNTKVSSAKTR